MNAIAPSTVPQMPMIYPAARSLISTSFPGPVFHYTDQAGSLGIIQTKAIWATDLRYLNDSREYSHGFDRIIAELARALF
jgi:hypothetical protein